LKKLREDLQKTQKASTDQESQTIQQLKKQISNLEAKLKHSEEDFFHLINNLYKVSHAHGKQHLNQFLNWAEKSTTGLRANLGKLTADAQVHLDKACSESSKLYSQHLEPVIGEHVKTAQKELRPHLYQIYHGLGFVEFMDKHYREAASLFSRAIRLADERGRGKYEVKQDKLALLHHMKALSLFRVADGCRYGDARARLVEAGEALRTARPYWDQTDFGTRFKIAFTQGLVESKLGDIAEGLMIHATLGAHADEVVVTSTKSMTGAMMATERKKKLQLKK